MCDESFDFFTQPGQDDLLPWTSGTALPVRQRRNCRCPNPGKAPAGCWTAARAGKPLCQIHLSSDDSRRPVQLLAVPVRQSEDRVGVLAMVISLDEIDRIMGERSGMGATASPTGKDELRMRSSSFGPGSPVERLSGTAANGVDTRASRGALAGVTRAEC
jgi:hypothetical protein